MISFFKTKTKTYLSKRGKSDGDTTDGGGISVPASLAVLLLFLVVVVVVVVVVVARVEGRASLRDACLTRRVCMSAVSAACRSSSSSSPLTRRTLSCTAASHANTSARPALHAATNASHGRSLRNANSTPTTTRHLVCYRWCCIFFPVVHIMLPVSASHVATQHRPMPRVYSSR
jgi:hypothetical protein